MNHNHRFRQRTQHGMTYRRGFDLVGIRAAFRFFHQHAGGAVDQKARNAWALAKAEHIAQQRGWECRWEWDGESASELKDLCWDCGRGNCSRDHECMGCVLRDENGNVLESLWGILDADGAYRRTVEAELASEALWREQESWGGTAHAI